MKENWSFWGNRQIPNSRIEEKLPASIPIIRLQKRYDYQNGKLFPISPSPKFLYLGMVGQN